MNQDFNKKPIDPSRSLDRVSTEIFRAKYFPNFLIGEVIAEKALDMFRTKLGLDLVRARADILKYKQLRDSAEPANYLFNIQIPSPLASLQDSGLMWTHRITAFIDVHNKIIEVHDPLFGLTTAKGATVSFPSELINLFREIYPGYEIREREINLQQKGEKICEYIAAKIAQAHVNQRPFPTRELIETDFEKDMQTIDKGIYERNIAKNEKDPDNRHNDRCDYFARKLLDQVGVKYNEDATTAMIVFLKKFLATITQDKKQQQDYMTSLFKLAYTSLLNEDGEAVLKKFTEVLNQAIRSSRTQSPETFSGAQDPGDLIIKFLQAESNTQLLLKNLSVVNTSFNSASSNERSSGPSISRQP